MRRLATLNIAARAARAASRPAETLLHLAKAYRKPVAGGMPIGIRLRQSELAAMLGASGDSINKKLHAFITEGLIDLERGYVAVRDLDALRRVVA